MDKNYIVSKSNVLINSSYDLSLEEQRIILTLASMVQPDDKDFKAYKFKIADFMKLLNVKSKTKYSDIPKITKELMQKVFEIKQDKRILQLAWLSSADYVEGTGIVELEFSPKLKPFMLGLKKFYTSYKLENILELKSKYSIRVYELLKSNEFKKVIEIPIDDLREMLKAQTTSYKIYQNFKNRIILQSQKELKEKTDITFDFEEIKTGRKVTSIKFHIKPNKRIAVQQEIAVTLDEDPTEPTEILKEVQAIFDESITGLEAKKIFDAAKGNINLIKEKYNIAQNTSSIKNIVGWIINAIKEDYAPQKSKDNQGNFCDYEQREIDFNKLEKQLLGYDAE